MSENFTIRFAEKEDVGVILDCIKGLAEYEKMLDQVTATEEILRLWLFEKKSAEVLIGELDGKAIGFALFFHNFSTFLGKAGLYLEDIFIFPEYRNRGYGKKFFSKLAQIAKERGCGRMEWSCLDWNEPSIEFYKSLGAVSMDGWTTYRLTEDKIEKIADNGI